jgi:two-component system response regulator AlgR
MRILLVDDEQLAREHLKRMLLELGSDYQLVAEAANGELAVAACNQHEVDLVLMDIHMPGMDGLEAARLLSDKPVPPAIIFTTAYGEHALSAFDVSAVDYLLKPIRREKLLAALKKAASLTRPQLAVARKEEALFLVSRAHGGLQRISLEDVFYLRADNKYVTARLQNREALLEESLKSLAEQYSQQFLRIHRNALVNMGRVGGLEKQPGGQLFLSFNGIGDKLEVSRRHQAEVREAIHR